MTKLLHVPSTNLVTMRGSNCGLNTYRVTRAQLELLICDLDFKLKRGMQATQIRLKIVMTKELLRRRIRKLVSDKHVKATTLKNLVKYKTRANKL